MGGKVKIEYTNDYNLLTPYFERAYGEVTAEDYDEQKRWGERYSLVRDGVKAVVQEYGSFGEYSESDFSVNPDVIFDHRIYVLIYNDNIISQELVFSIWSYLSESVMDDYAVLIDASGKPIDLYCCILKNRIIYYSADDVVLQGIQNGLSSNELVAYVQNSSVG